MPHHLHLDFETFSEAELTDVGAYRYAFDPTTEILCAAMALDDEEPVVWQGGAAHWFDSPFREYFNAMEDPNILIYAHHAQFEIAICRALLEKTWGIPAPAISRFRCTMSLARRAALPGSLDKLGEVLSLTTQKDKRGKALMKRFCVPQKPKEATKHKPAIPAHRIRPQDDPAGFAELLAYCQQDVRAEQQVAKKLAYFDDALNNSNYILHETINARGVTVNLMALRNAQKLIEEETEIVGQRFRELTGFEFTQNKVFLGWLHGCKCPLENLQAEAIENFLANYEDAQITDDDETTLALVVRALRMKQSVAYVSIKKVQTMLACAGPSDNRIRGMLNHHGATTGRSTNSLVQFQNMKRPAGHLAAPTGPGSKLTWSEVAYQAICDGISRDELEICFGPVLEVISSCIRHFVQDV